MKTNNESVISNFVEVELNDESSFLRIQETLSRIGIVSRNKKTLFQSCHILHKRGKYYIVHFKEMFMLDGKESSFSESDKLIRNKIATLLSEWGLLTLKDEKFRISSNVRINNLTILSYDEKKEWTLETKYDIGKKRGNYN